LCAKRQPRNQPQQPKSEPGDPETGMQIRAIEVMTIKCWGAGSNGADGFRTQLGSPY